MILRSSRRRLLPAILGWWALGAETPPKQIQPETARAFDCYIQAAETRMNARSSFLEALADPSKEEVVRGGRVLTIAPNGPNPHKIAGGQIYDWIGTVYLPGASMERVVRMLQDYDHRPRYFPETISTSRLLCRTGKDHFHYTMRLKEPAPLDVESDVVWERVDPQRSRVRSYSTNVQEEGKDHGYLRRLYSYWRVAAADKGVYVEGETITLSDEFGSLKRFLGSRLLGIDPEKSLRQSLNEMRDALMRPELQISDLPEGLPECAQVFHPGACAESK